MSAYECLVDAALALSISSTGRGHHPKTVAHLIESLIASPVESEYLAMSPSQSNRTSMKGLALCSAACHHFGWITADSKACSGS